MEDRESTVSFPNEEVDKLLQAGAFYWDSEIDVSCHLKVQREKFDTFLIKHGVIRDYKEVNRFLAGLNNGKSLED